MNLLVNSRRCYQIQNLFFINIGSIVPIWIKRFAITFKEMGVSATCNLNMTNLILLEIFGNVKCHDFLKFNLLQNKHIWSLHSSLYTGLNFVVYLLQVLPCELEPLSVIMTVVWFICSCYIYSKYRGFSSSHGRRYPNDRHSLLNL